MANVTRDVITAIRSNKDENFVATSLSNMGWQIVHRATSIDSALIAIEKNPQSVLIYADDFNLPLRVLPDLAVKFDGEKVTEQLQLQELLLNLGDERSTPDTYIAPSRSKVTLAIALERGAGASTIALNLAYLAASGGDSTLLLDCNLAHPSISNFLDIQRINQRIIQSRFGFSVGEPSTLPTFEMMASESSHFAETIIDLGEMPGARFRENGRRMEEQIYRWSIQSARQIVMISRDFENVLKNARDFKARVDGSGLPIICKLLLVRESHQSLREHNSMVARIHNEIGVNAQILTYDRRTTMSARELQTPLMAVSPKSALARDIAALHSEGI